MRFLDDDAIDLPALVARVASADHGAVVTFAGLVRDHHAGRTVIGLSYSAYHDMAETLAAGIVTEGESRWPVRIALAHRIGELRIGDVAVGIAVAARHRDEGFEACRWVIDEVKRRLPIWKRETYADGSVAWVDPTAQGGVIPAKT